MHQAEPEESPKPVTELLIRWNSGDAQALERLFPLLYGELKQLARGQLRQERPGHTLQSAALVHEAYLRLLDQAPSETNNRAHFLMLAARLMRQILVDHARTRAAQKRGAGLTIHLEPEFMLADERSLDVVALDDALNDLSRLDEQQGRIVELRFFCGLATEEIAEVLSVSCSTVKRDWNVAKVWLARQLKRGAQHHAGAVAEG